MSATMARQGCRAQLEQSDIRLGLNMAIMPKEKISCTAIEETQQQIKEPPAKVRKEKKQGVVFPGHNKGNPVMERHPAMVRENQMDGCHHCQNGTAKNSQTRWGRKGTGAPPP